MGRELAVALSPSDNLLEIATRQQETTEARQLLDKGGTLDFGPGLDFREYVQRALLGGLLRGAELYPFQGLIEAARYTRSNLARHEELPLLSAIGDNLPDLQSIERDIRGSISQSGEILDNASDTLRQLRQEARAAHERLDAVMERNLRRMQRQELVQEPIVTERNGRMVLLIKAEMRTRVPGIVHDVSDSGATVFVEPMGAIDLGNRWREARLAEQREEERILRRLSGLVGQVGEDLLLMLDLMARLDLAIAKGRYSAALAGIPPQVSKQSDGVRFLRLSEARHPSLSGNVVPISLEFGAGNRIMLITGPNAGGKTVGLKTVGLLALMAQSGLHVPAREARLPLFDGIYTDIGDQQSIEQSLSTFSSHIRNLLKIMKLATAHSLVLVDELGTSTDPEEGSALAKAVLSYFLGLGVLLVATTHHRGVARFVQEQEGMINASVDLHPESLEPTYRITLGLPGRSYALTIASSLGLPEEIIHQAKNWLSPTEQATESLLKELQEERQLVDALRLEAESHLSLAKEQQAQAEEQLASVELTKADLVEESRQELLQGVNDLVARLQWAERALDRPERQELQQERVRLIDARRELTSPDWQPIVVQRSSWKDSVKSGDRVYIRGVPQPVEVISATDNQSRLEVLIGTMRATIPVYQLERPAPGHETAAGAGVHLSRSDRKPAPSEMDLRGLRVDQAIHILDGWLNDAALDGTSSLRIIHGKGTGALRNAIREWLDKHPLVASASAGQGPGGDGVTVAELR
jgi:DNA mismatch repair protein MutS2